MLAGSFRRGHVTCPCACRCRKQSDRLCLVVVTADGQRPDGREPQQQNQPHAAFGPEPWSCSLQVSSAQAATKRKGLQAGSRANVQNVITFIGQEALQRSRPDFIARSQSRLRELERRRLERRELGGSSAGAGRRRVHRGRPAPPPPPPHNGICTHR